MQLYMLAIFAVLTVSQPHFLAVSNIVLDQGEKAHALIVNCGQLIFPLQFQASSHLFLNQSSADDQPVQSSYQYHCQSSEKE